VRQWDRYLVPQNVYLVLTKIRSTKADSSSFFSMQLCSVNVLLAKNKSNGHDAHDATFAPWLIRHVECMRIVTLFNGLLQTYLDMCRAGFVHTQSFNMLNVVNFVVFFVINKLRGPIA